MNHHLLHTFSDHLREHGQKVGVCAMGVSVTSWASQHGMACLSAAGIVTSIVIQVLSYRLRVLEVKAKLEGRR